MTVLIAQTVQQYVFNRSSDSVWLSSAVSCMSLYQLKPWHQRYHRTIVVTGHMHFWRIADKYRSNKALFMLALGELEQSLPP